MRFVGLLAAAVLLAGTEQSTRFYVTSVASSLIDQGLASSAPAGSEVSAFQEVSVPGIQFRPNQAQATEAPWVTSNGWRFLRGLAKANYAKLPAGAAPLAAAEAFTYGVEAILDPDPADIESLGHMLRFLKTQAQPPLPVIANIAVVDDRSPEMSEALNMLTRRNLLYRVVSAPERELPTVRLGSADFPRESAKNPSEFAARVREKIGDDNRLVRVYGTSTAIVHLTGDRERARLFVLGYGGNRRRQGREQQNVRVRVLGRYAPASFAAFGAAPEATLVDVENPGNATEFSLPAFSVCAIVDLKGTK
jgi:hypothetical protein